MDAQPVLSCQKCGGEVVTFSNENGIERARCTSCETPYVSISGTVEAKHQKSLKRASGGDPGIKHITLRIKLPDGSERTENFDYYYAEEAMFKKGDRVMVVLIANEIVGVINNTTDSSYKAGPPPRPPQQPATSCLGCIVPVLIIVAATAAWSLS